MKRSILALMVVALLSPITSRAALVPTCTILPTAKSRSCSLRAPAMGSVLYVLQGAVEVDIVHASILSRTCFFGSAVGNGIIPRVFKGDSVTIRKVTSTTTFFGMFTRAAPGRSVGQFSRYICP